jgi:predicted dehydrogenase
LADRSKIKKKMSESKLKIAILGLDGEGQLLAKAASRMDYFQIQAVADRDANLAERVAAEYKCAGYDDYRQLVIQNQLDCLLVAAGMHSCDEHIRAAMKKKFNILKLAPAARNFEEAVEFVRLAEDENVKFAVANPYRFAQSFRAFRQFLQEGRLEQIFLIVAFCNVGEGPHSAWRSDPKLAGGGVLLCDCYQIIDQILWNFPIPQQVYSLNTSQAVDKQQRLCLTEDTALVTMKFSDTLTGNLVAFRRAGQGAKQDFLSVYGKDRILTVNPSRFAVSDGLGQIIEETKSDDDELLRMTKLLKDFALSILLPQENKLTSSGRENLKDMAVIEAAYLSARTSLPEEPVRVLQMAQLGPGDIQAASRPASAL